MFGLFRSKKVKSPFREWAESQRKSSGSTTVKDSFLISNLHAISLFNDEVVKDKNDFRNRLMGDATLFEIGAFIIFHIDFRLFVKDKANKDVVMNFMLPGFLGTFKKYVNCQNIDHVLQSRFDIYGQILREHKNNYLPIVLEYLCEFIYRTRDNTSPEIIKQADYFTTNTNMMEIAVTNILVTTYVNNFLPIVYENTDMIVEIMKGHRRS
ncbi:MAG: hypothetical protein KF845_07725 [Cyclobacteriaceae bacterium]|nr:hypothetical protein [Cyclobacteriaceae bacterium]